MNSVRTPAAIAGRLLIGVAAGVSLYLAAIALSRSSLPARDVWSACQEVTTSRWAYTFGIPVSFAGFVLYSLTLLLSWSYVRRDRSFAGLLGGMAVSTVLAGAVWFTALQIFALEPFCLWCSLIHGSAVAGAFLLWRSRLKHPVPDLDCTTDLRDAGSPFSNDRVFRFTATGAALVAIGLLALGSLSGPLHRVSAAPVPSSAISPAARGAFTLMDGKYHLEPADYPFIGSDTNAAPAAVLLSDYTCEPCLKYHAILENVVRTGAPGARILVLPAARSPEAEDIQRTLLTVFHADRSAWHSLSALITSGQIPAKPEAVSSAAQNLIGAEKIAAAAQAHADRIQQQIKLAAAVLNDARGGRESGSATLPQLICGTRVLNGAETDQRKLIAFLTEQGQSETRPPLLPRLSILNSEVRLNGANHEQPQEIAINVRNTGNAPLKIEWLALGHDCEVTALPAGSIPAGQIAVIGVRVTPPAGGGVFERKLRIHSSAPGEPGVVTVRGGAEPHIANRN